MSYSKIKKTINQLYPAEIDKEFAEHLKSEVRDCMLFDYGDDLAKILNIVERFCTKDELGADPLYEEKKALAKNLTKAFYMESYEYYREHKNEDSDEYDELSSLVLDQFFELYIKPYYGVLGDQLASFREVDNVVQNSDWLNPVNGLYDDAFCSIKIRTGRGVLYKLDTMLHEYEHNLQYRGSSALQSFGLIQKSFVEDFADKYAWELKKEEDYYATKEIEDEDVESLYEVFSKGRKHNYKVPDGHSFYYHQAIERDARMASNSMMMKFLVEMLRCGMDSDSAHIKIARCAEEIYNEERKFWMDEGLNDLVRVLDNITTEDYIEYCKTIWEKLEKDQAKIYAVYEQQLEKAKKGEIDKSQIINLQKTLTEHFCRDYERILSRALLFKSYDVDLDVGGYFLKNKDKAQQILLEFIRMGYSAIVNELYSMGSGRVIEQNLFQMFKHGDICTESCDFVDDLTWEHKSEILIDYLRDGKFEFYSRILEDYNKGYQMVNPLLEYIGYQWFAFANINYMQSNMDSTEIKKRIESINARYDNKNNIDDFDELRSLIIESEKDNIKNGPAFCAFQEKFEELKKQQEQGKLVYDDIDDYISLVAQMCELLQIDYREDEIYFVNDIEGEEPIQKIFQSEDPVMDYISQFFYNLYVESERLAFKEVCKKLGYVPSVDQYRFAHAGDRRMFRLKGEAADKRYREIYGDTAYQYMIMQRKLAEEYDRTYTETLKSGIDELPEIEK